MDAEEAADAVNKLVRPKKVVIPMHYNAIVGTRKTRRNSKNL